MKYKPFFIIVFLVLLLPGFAHAQKLEKLIELLTVHPNKKAVAKDSSLYPSKAIFTPVISFAPETNLSFGLGMKGLFKPKGSDEHTRTSNIPLTVQYTIENKYLFFSGFDIFFPQERYRLSGNVSIQSFPSLYFGVGQNTPNSNEEEFAYNQVLIEPIFLKNILIPNLFIGAGPRYNRIGGVEAEPEGLLDLSEQSGSEGSTSVGAQFAIIYDSRDNVLNANKGLYLEFTQGYYDDILSGTHNFKLTRMDARYYLPITKNAWSILAFHMVGLFSNGNTPLLELGRLGGDEIMRGYFEGRYTENNLIAGQVEWRQKLSRLWGVVAFAGLGGVAPTLGQLETDYIRPSVGLGLRFLVDPEENLNLRLDYGIGQNKSNFYLKIAEAF
jgi:hypothetical protein